MIYKCATQKVMIIKTTKYTILEIILKHIKIFGKNQNVIKFILLNKWEIGNKKSKTRIKKDG